MEQTFRASGEQVEQFAELTGDDNEIHVDEDAAAESIFGERVIHGVYGLGWVSSMLADLADEDETTILTGFESVTFEAPIHITEAVVIELSIVDERTVYFEAHSGLGEKKFSGEAGVAFS